MQCCIESDVIPMVYCTEIWHFGGCLAGYLRSQRVDANGKEKENNFSSGVISARNRGMTSSGTRSLISGGSFGKTSSGMMVQNPP